MNDMMHNPLFVSLLLIGVFVALAAIYVVMRAAAGRLERQERQAAATKRSAPPRADPES